MSQTDCSIEAIDGFQLGASVFDAGSISKSHVIIIVSDIGIRRSFYSRLATFLSRQGFQVVTFDFRGVGDSLHTPIHKCKASLTDWAFKDLSAVITWAKNTFPDARRTLMAHGTGGHLLPLTPNRRLVQSVIFVATQHGYWKNWAMPGSILLALLWYVVVPVLSFIRGYMPSNWLGLGDPIPRGVAEEGAFWCRHPDFMARANPDMVHAQFASLKVPMLAFSLSDDPIAPPRTVERILSWYTDARLTIRHINLAEHPELESVGHLGFFSESNRRPLWEDHLLVWLRNLGIKPETIVQP